MGILFINACIRKEDSRTLKLAKQYLERFKDKDIKEVDLQELFLNNKLYPLTKESLHKRDSLISTLDFSNSMFDLARDFKEAEEIIIAAPYWDLSFPTLLKMYFERVCVIGLTFTYTNGGIPKGLLNASDATYITTAGGYLNNLNLGYDYTASLLKNMFSIQNVNLIAAEGLDDYNNNAEEIIDNKLKEIQEM